MRRGARCFCSCLLTGNGITAVWNREKICRVFSDLRDFQVRVKSVNPFGNAQVCAGGVPLSEVTDRMESVKHPGLYFAGELLDVDGRCGGYNLQWAWTSGFLAGKG